MKKILLLLMAGALFSACKKTADLPELPSYAQFKMNSSSTNRTFEVMVGDSVLAEDLSASRSISRYVVAGSRRLRIRETGTDNWFLDSVIDVKRPGVEFSMIDLGPETEPLILQPEDIKTTAPAAGAQKYSLLNIDVSPLLKDRVVDINFYDLNPDDGSFILVGELKGLEHLKMSGFIELKNPVAGTFFLQIMDSGTGEVLLPVESYAGSMACPQNGDNVFLVKIMNVGDDSWPYVSADPLLGVKR